MKVRPWLCRDIDEGIDPAPRCEHHCPVASQERLSRLAVDRHHASLDLVNFDRDHSALAGIDETQSEPLVRPAGEVRGEASVDREDRNGVVRIGAGGNTRAIRPDPPVFDEDDLVSIGSYGFVLPDDQRVRSRRPPPRVREQAKIAQESAGVTEGQWRGYLGCPGRQWLDGGDAIDAPPIQRSLRQVEIEG